MELIRLYLKSPLLPNIYLELITFLEMSTSPEDVNRLVSAALEYIDRFPDFPGIKTAVNHYRLGLQREAGICPGRFITPEQTKVIERKLELLKAKYAQNLVARYASEEIKRMHEPVKH